MVLGRKIMFANVIQPGDICGEDAISATILTAGSNRFGIAFDETTFYGFNDCNAWGGSGDLQYYVRRAWCGDRRWEGLIPPQLLTSFVSQFGNPPTESLTANGYVSVSCMYRSGWDIADCMMTSVPWWYIPPPPPPESP
jgi:hypothetical protein